MLRRVPNVQLLVDMNGRVYRQFFVRDVRAVRARLSRNDQIEHGAEIRHRQPRPIRNEIRSRAARIDQRSVSAVVEFVALRVDPGWVPPVDAILEIEVSPAGPVVEPGHPFVIPKLVPVAAVQLPPEEAVAPDAAAVRADGEDRQRVAAGYLRPVDRRRDGPVAVALDQGNGEIEEEQTEQREGRRPE